MAKDAIAEQSLAASLRKMIDRELDLAFLKAQTTAAAPDGTEGTVISPSVQIVISKALPMYGVRLSYPTPVGGEILRDDKALAIALAAAIHGYGHYEAAAIQELERRKQALDATRNGNGSGGKLIVEP